MTCSLFDKLITEIAMIECGCTSDLSRMTSLSTFDSLMPASCHTSFWNDVSQFVAGNYNVLNVTETTYSHKTLTIDWGCLERFL